MLDCTRRIFVLAATGAELPAIRRKDWQPAYIRLGEHDVRERAATLRSFYKECRLCPRHCGVSRLGRQKGVCGSTSVARVASWHPHFGEERPLVGRYGSGTIFFSRCNLLCEYCQNWQISHSGDGENVTDDQVAAMMLDLQRQGCHNINLVTPTHIVPNIVAALHTAMFRGLRIPLVYNCGGYEPVEVLRALDGIIDIYLPDFKYMDGTAAARYSRGAEDYPEVCAAAIAEMYRQVGNLVLDERGVALRGLIIRHLVLPENKAGTDRFVKWVADNLARAAYVNIMPQYRPMHRARLYPEINRPITKQEFAQALQWAHDAGLTNVAIG
jgi:putative pyruvate formate lyase activating enzyme